MLFLPFFIIVQNGVLGQNSSFRHAETLIKGSKDADDRLVSKKIWANKKANWIGAQS